MPTGIFKHKTGWHHSEETRRKISQSEKGKVISFEQKIRVGKKLKGNKHTLGMKHSKEAKEKMSIIHKGKKFSIEHRNKLSMANSGKKFPERCGKNHPNWKGGVTSLNEKIRKSLEYKLWRKAIFVRDNYTCIWCGQVGGRLNADHKKPFRDYPEIRFAIDNGRTLCEDCHKTTDTYGFKVLYPNTKQELSLWKERS